MKLFKNVKIIACVILVLILSISFMSTITFYGYTTMNQMKNYQDKIYNDQLLSINSISDTQADFLHMRLYITKAIFDYKGIYITNADDLDKHVIKQNDELIVSFTKMKEKKADLVQINVIKEYYSKYSDTWSGLKAKLQHGNKLSTDEISNITNLGTALDGHIAKLTGMLISEADTLDIKAGKDEKNAAGFFFVYSVFSLIILTFISLVVIFIIRYSTKEIIQSLKHISSGDFTEKIDIYGKSEFGIMKKALAETLEKVSILLSSIKKNAIDIGSYAETLSDTSEEMTSSSQEVSTAIQQVAEGSGAQASELSDINGTVSHFGEELEHITSLIGDVESNAKRTDSMAKEDSEKLKNLVQAIHSIGNSFEDVSKKISLLGQSINQVSEITNIINSIAEQTNLLALNAAIEAARAGESGRGFAVVADEIRKLAEQSKTSSDSIKKLVNEIYSESNSVVKTTEIVNTDLNKQVKIIEDTIVSFKEIIDSIGLILPKVEDVNDLASQINQEKNSIVSRVSNIAAVSEETSASSEEISASAEQMSAASQEVSATSQTLNHMTKEMLDQVDKFKI